MDELIKKISRMDNGVVFVGGVSEVKHGIRKKTKDVDIVVQSLSGLEAFGVLKYWITDSAVSKSGKRAFIERLDFNIDIFVEDDLPEWELIDGVKCQTIKSMISHYLEAEKKASGRLKEIINGKLKRLKNEQ